MNSSDPEIRLLVWLTIIGFSLNLILGIIGILLPENSFNQLLFFQLGDSAATMGCVIAGRYVGLKGQHIAASAFVMLGITHGISLAASGLESLNAEKGIFVIMPMVPAFALMYRFTLIPIWLRWLGFAPPLLFIYNYMYVIQGNPYFDWPTIAGYGMWMLVEILWAFYIWKDWSQSKA